MKTDFNTVNSAGLLRKLQVKRYIFDKKPAILHFLAKCFVDKRCFSTFVRRLANGYPELTDRTITCEHYPSYQKFTL